MKPVTSFDDHITHARYTGLRITEHYLTFFDGICVQHYIVVRGFMTSPDWTVDYSETSKLIGKTLKEAIQYDPNWVENTWEAAIHWLSLNIEPRLWLAGRYEFLRDWSADHEIDPSLFKAIYEASK